MSCCIHKTKLHYNKRSYQRADENTNLLGHRIGIRDGHLDVVVSVGNGHILDDITRVQHVWSSIKDWTITEHYTMYSDLSTGEGLTLNNEKCSKHG